MAVYDGVPSIRLEGDQERALALIPEAKALLYKVQTFKDRAGVPTHSMSRRVGDDAYIYVLSAREQNLIHISVSPSSTDEVYELPEADGGTLPLTMLSGMVVRGYVEEQSSANGSYMATGIFYPTSTCQRMNDLPAGGQFLHRLNVTPHSLMGELENSEPQPTYSQYTKLRPSMYTGKMQQVVQAVMGLGRMPEPMLRTMKDLGTRTTYVDEVRTNGVRVLYDYKQQRTHGITVAADGRLWLVEISITRGVLAMPLPIYPESDTQGFRDKFEARNDSDIVAVLDELGVFPTGETFPLDVPSLNQRLLRGDILRLLPPTALSEYYSTSPYSTALGWAFSPDGSEAHNTGYYYGEDGYQRGVWWQINLRIGATDPNWVPGEGPLAQATATPLRMGEGFLYSDRNVAPTNPRAYLPFKTHQPGYGLLSHSAQPLYNLPPVYCDTAVHVCFINGDLHVVRFYRNPRTFSHDDIEDDRYPGECLYNGQWRIVDRRGERGIPPMMYSNREDPRRVAHASITETNIVSTDLGFGPPQYSDMPLYLQYASVFRTRYFKYVSDTTVSTGENVVCAVSVPEYAREAYYMAYGEETLSQTTSRLTRYDSLVDPNRGISWRCLAGFGEGGLPGVPLDPLICGGDCSPLTTAQQLVHPDRRIVYTYRTGGDCSDFADGGQWLDTCMSVEGFGGPPSYPPATTVTTPPAYRSSGWLKLYMTSIGGHKQMPFSYGRAWAWWRPSPDPTSGEVHKIAAYHNALGADGIVYMTDYQTYGGRNTEGFFIAPVSANVPIPCFIGVHRP